MRSWSAILPVVLLAAAGCSPTTATTAEDFVKQHAKAYYFNDAKAVAKMTLCAEDSGEVVLPEQIREELRTFHRDSLVRALKDEMKEESRWVSAWRDTKYVSEQDRGGHIAVQVKVGYANSSIVLVRAGKTLKIAPNPSSFE